MKYLKWTVIGIVVLIVVVVLGVWLGLDSVVRSEVQSQATSSLNLETTLAFANVSIFGQSLSLKDMQIASPKGFSAPKMFTLGGVKVDVSISNLRSDPIIIDQVTIDKPYFVIEQANGKFNFRVLSKTSKKPAETPPPSSDGKRPAGAPIHVIIHDLQINNPQVALRPGIPGLSSEIDIPIQSFDLKDIGSGNGAKNGVAMREVFMQVMTALAQKTTESNALPPEVKDVLSLNVGAVQQELQQQVTQQLGNLGKGVQIGGDAGKNAGDAISKGLGGLLGGGKKDNSNSQ
jgi:uncharacterized protein involved in outer membrane biogenesis